MKEDIGMEIVDWIIGLFEEIEEPTYIDRTIAVCLLSAEIDGWKKDPTI